VLLGETLMRIYLIMNEEHFYQPNFIASFLKRTTDNVVGAALVTKVKKSYMAYLIKNWYHLRLFEIVKLIFNGCILFAKDVLYNKHIDKPFYSARSVFKFFKIDFIEVRYDINRKAYINKIREKKPDVIISSCSTIFNDELLGIPRICCLNRHSSLLPSYGGVWPVFQAYRSGDKYVGASINMMERSIDTGTVLAQEKIRIERTDTIADLYHKTFKSSVDMLLEALEKVRTGDLNPCSQNKPSYFSFPTSEHWHEFRMRGGKFI